jgi:hypothetical protein
VFIRKNKTIIFSKICSGIMLYRFFFPILLIAFFSCSSYEKKKDFHALAAEEINEKGFIASSIPGSPNILIQAKGFTGVIFDRDNKDLGDDNAFTPTLQEVLLAEEILLNCFKVDTVDFNHDSMYISKRQIEPLPEYRRQYTGRFNKDGQRFISINCFRYNKENSYSTPHWLRRMMYVKDGGNNYWRIAIDLSAKRCGYFSVNGLAFHSKLQSGFFAYVPPFSGY